MILPVAMEYGLYLLRHFARVQHSVSEDSKNNDNFLLFLVFPADCLHCKHFYAA